QTPQRSQTWKSVMFSPKRYGFGGSAGRKTDRLPSGSVIAIARWRWQKPQPSSRGTMLRGSRSVENSSFRRPQWQRPSKVLIAIDPFRRANVVTGQDARHGSNPPRDEVVRPLSG